MCPGPWLIFYDAEVRVKTANTSSCWKGGKGLRKEGSTHHKKALRYKIHQVRYLLSDFLGGGVKHISDLIYEETQGVLEAFLRTISRMTSPTLSTPSKNCDSYRRDLHIRTPKSYFLGVSSLNPRKKSWITRVQWKRDCSSQTNAE